jgi:chitodextrinase
MRFNREMRKRMTSVRGGVTAAVAFALFTTLLASCGELTGPESPSAPTDVKAVLLSSNSVKVTWTPSPLNDGVISYSIYRDGAKVGESETTEFTDTGLAQQTTYVYSVAANCKGGIVSDRSAETSESTRDSLLDLRKELDKLRRENPLAPQQPATEHSLTHPPTHTAPAPKQAAELEIEGPELDLGDLIL